LSAGRIPIDAHRPAIGVGATLDLYSSFLELVKSLRLSVILPQLRHFMAPAKILPWCHSILDLGSCAEDKSLLAEPPADFDAS
jgi:hypothetical protein